jgi:transcription termination/antitermination protein NusA
MASEDIDRIRRLFLDEIPEVAAGTVELKAIAREPGFRTKIAICSRDPQVDCVGVCVGVGGVRIRRIVEQLDGERIDLVRWDDRIEQYIRNALLPAEIEDVRVDRPQNRATVVVREDQVALAMGRRGQNQLLASGLCECVIQVTTRQSPPTGEMQ